MLRGYALLVVLIAAGFLWGGWRLAMVGGSLYYVAAGVLLAISGVLLWYRRGEGRQLYAGLLLITLTWAVYESGADGWALAPRLVFLVIVGAGLRLPWLHRALRPSRFVLSSSIGNRALTSVILIGLSAGLGWGLYLGTQEPVDPVFRTGMGKPSGDTGVVVDAPEEGEWSAFGGKGGLHFSGLTQITPQNVRNLKIAWTYRTGDPNTLQVNPLKIENTLYICNGVNDVVALDAETGKERWVFRSGADKTRTFLKVCRGVAYYKVPDATGECSERIFTNTIDARLIAIDAQTGKRCASFGDDGQVSLLTGMGKVTEGYYYPTSAPTVVRGKIVLGGYVADGQYWGEPPGVVRAYDAVTGGFAWAFDMGRPGQHGEPPPGEQYTPSTPNAWAPMAADEELGMVYVPIGNATGSDYAGMVRRPYDEEYSTSVVALNAETGAPVWHFQTVHHDVWDYDLAPQPVVVDLMLNGRLERALVQPTKVGEIYVLDRATGRPLREVREVPAPQGGKAPEETLSPTQPVSPTLPSFRGPVLRERDMWGITPFDQMWCRIKFKQARYEGIYTPPGVTPSVQYPGYQGGIEWGSVSINPERNTMVVNSTRVAHYVQLIPREQADRMGAAPLTDMTKWSLPNAQANTPYAAAVLPFLSPVFAPCQEPPYGMISGVDLTTGKLLWTQRFGTARDSGPLGIPSNLPIPLGTPNTGGSIATRSGLTFIAASQDRYLRAYETETGRLLWKGRVPAGAQATPVTYLAGQSGRQFVVVAAGGSASLMTKKGDYIVAFALPQ